MCFRDYNFFNWAHIFGRRNVLLARPFKNASPPLLLPFNPLTNSGSASFDRHFATNQSFMGGRNGRLIVFFIFLVNLLHISSFSLHAEISKCFWKSGNYTINSIYQTNLVSLLSSIALTIHNSGFFNGSMGEGSDWVAATAVCRADTQLGDCRNCIRNATVHILNDCPFIRKAVVWQDDCTIRFSNETILGIMADKPISFVSNSKNISTSSVQQFNTNLNQLLDDLRKQASAGGPLLKAAAGYNIGPNFLTIYALVQCTPDISASDCDRCLITAAGLLPAYGRVGFRVLFPSCTLRYEISPFFNLTRIQEVEGLLAPPSPPPLVRGMSKKIIVVVAAVSGCIILALCVFFCYKRKQRKKQKERPRETTTNDANEGEISTIESLQYEFGKIRAATDDFSEANKIGRGGFGTVYKGKLENGKEIAVKRLSKVSSQGESEFKNEVLLMSKLRHRNLLKIFGFAIQGEERLLIYEFLQNLSLDHFIFDPIKRSQMDWNRRYKIIGGIARALLYLHQDSPLRIIHRDLKASNVLLDNQMNPKIADFGLAMLFALDETEGNTSRIAGTYGYMAPEYAIRGKVTVKTDVYSFGVLVLEIISGQKSSSFINGDMVENIQSFAWRNWREGTIEENMIDPILRGPESLQDALRCIQIGLLCVQNAAAARPTMVSVLVMLNDSSIPVPIPSRPAFFVPRSTDCSTRDTQLMESAETSRNEASSTTELYPR